MGKEAGLGRPQIGRQSAVGLEDLFGQVRFTAESARELSGDGGSWGGLEPSGRELASQGGDERGCRRLLPDGP